MLRLRLTITGIIAIGVLMAGLAFLFPNNPYISNGENMVIHNGLALLLFMSALSVGSGIIFLYNLRGFSFGFRKTYYFLAAGIILQGIGILVRPIATYIALYSSKTSILAGDMAVKVDIISSLPLLAGIMCMYIGLIMYTKQLYLRAWTANLGIVLPLLWVTVLTVLFLPHIAVNYGELYFDIEHSLAALEFVLYGVAILLTLRIKQTTGRMYAASLRWLMIAFSILFFGTFLFKGGNFIEILHRLPTELTAAPFLFVHLSLLLAGYAFAKVAQGYKQTIQSPPSGQTLVESVLFLAGLFSNTRQIDPQLDILRSITAASVNNTDLSAHDYSQLQKLYYSLEEALISEQQDTIYTKDDLRIRVQELFGWTPT